jgi:hypothetical protein
MVGYAGSFRVYILSPVDCLSENKLSGCSERSGAINYTLMKKSTTLWSLS